MTQHTPGPWHVCNGASHLIADSHFMTVAEARQIVSGNLHTGKTEYVPGHKMQEANARLIAAAPDLLAALQFVDKWFAMRSTKGDDAPSQIVDSVANAIAKATGTASENIP